MSSVLVRDTFSLDDLAELANQDCRVQNVIPRDDKTGETWVVLQNTLTDHIFAYKLHEVYSFLRTMRG